MTDRLRVGVAGLGFGASVHVPALQQLPGVEVVALAGSTRERAGAAAARLGVPVACGGIDELLQQELDAVTLALPPHLTAPAVERALARGLAVLCEKPLSDSAADAARVATLAQGRTNAIDFQFAELATFRALKTLLDSGRIGRVRQCSVTWLVESYAHRQRQWSWKLDAARGGGVLNILGAHSLYLAEWLLGPCSSVQASLDRSVSAAIAPTGARPAEDAVALTLTGRDGWLLTAMIGNAAPGGPTHRWEIVGTRGRAVLANDTADYMAGFRLTVGGDAAAVEPAAAGDGRLPAFQSLAARFVAAARERRAVTPDFSAGARVQALIEAVHAAAATGRRIEV